MKKIFVVALLIIVVLLVAGCTDNTVMKQEDINGTKDDFSIFVEVERAGTWRIVYDRETLCMYAISDSSYNCGIFTLLVNPDGSPKLWED